MSNKLTLTKQALDSTKSLNEMFELPAVVGNSIMNVVKTTGLDQRKAELHYEREKILFLKTVSANKKFESCDKFTVYSAWVELMASGLTLNDGATYLIPYGKVCQFQIGWKGRLDQMGQIPEIINIPPPQVVYDNDDFDYELGEKPRIIKHKPAKDNKGELAYVYLVIEKKSGKETHIMTREEVLSIRDRYSKGYNQYVADCKAAGKVIGETFKKNMGNYDITVEPPMWVSSEAQAWKKTLVKRAWNSQANKTARMKAVDAAIKNNVDIEDSTAPEKDEAIDYAIASGGETVDTSTGEVTKDVPHSVVVEEKTKAALNELDEL